MIFMRFIPIKNKAEYMMYVCVCVCMEGKIWKDKEKGNEITADSS